MTREEAIKILKFERGYICDFKGCQEQQAFTMAIKALEQEPCEDAISRADAKKYLSAPNENGDRVIYESDLDLLPPVTPQPKTGHWIETAEEYYKAINEKGGGVDENTPYFTDDIACSECLAKFSVIDNETERFIYCPNCGTKMESEVRNE